MRRLALFLTVLAACSVLAAEKCDIGGKLHSLPSPEWMDGTFRKVADIRGNKKFAVLYIWRPDQAALTDFPRITAVTEKFRKQVAFAGIAIAGKERIKRFPGALRLGFPINADNKNAIADAVALPSKSPVALVLDSQNTLLWSGATAALPMILQECLDGKFDLKEEIRKNQFTNAVNKAVREQKFAEAYQLLNGEWKKTCDSLELLNAQVLLLTRKLNRADDAFALLHEAQRKNPGKHLFFEAEYRLLGHPAHAKRVPDFFVRVKQSFRDQPGVLMAFAMAEMGRPAESLDLPLVLSLVEMGWRSKGFAKDTSRGLYALEYAKIAHTCGRVDIAAKLADIAVKLLKSDSKRQAGAKRAQAYYRKIQEIAPRFKPVDLKK